MNKQINKITTTLIITIMVLMSSVTMAGELDKLADKQSKTGFLEWLQDKNNSSEVYFIPQSTFTSRSRDKYIKVFNRVQAQGGSYKKFQIKKWGCDYLTGWTVGRILETTPGSKIVKIEYKWPRSQRVNYGWVHSGVIEKMDDYRKRLAQ